MLRPGQKIDFEKIAEPKGEAISKKVKTSQDVIDVYNNLTEMMEELYSLINKKIDLLKQSVQSSSGGPSLGAILIALSALDGSTGFLKQTDASTFLKTLVDLTSDVSGVLPYANGGRGYRIDSTASRATLTPNFDNYDMHILTAQAETLEIANPGGTPVNGFKLIMRIYTASAQTITWSGSYYRAMHEALPTLTIAEKTLYLGFIWNSTDTKYDLVAMSQEA